MQLCFSLYSFSSPLYFSSKFSFRRIRSVPSRSLRRSRRSLDHLHIQRLSRPSSRRTPGTSRMDAPVSGASPRVPGTHPPGATRRPTWAPCTKHGRPWRRDASRHCRTQLTLPTSCPSCHRCLRTTTTRFARTCPRQARHPHGSCDTTPCASTYRDHSHHRHTVTTDGSLVSSSLWERSDAYTWSSSGRRPTSRTISNSASTRSMIRRGCNCTPTTNTCSTLVGLPRSSRTGKWRPCTTAASTSRGKTPRRVRGRR